LLLGVGFRELHCFSSRADRSGHPVSNFFEYVLVITQFAFAIYRHHLALCSTCVSKTRYPFVTPQTCRKGSDGLFPSPLLLASPSPFLYTIIPVSHTFFVSEFPPDTPMLDYVCSHPLVQYNPTSPFSTLLSPRKRRCVCMLIMRSSGTHPSERESDMNSISPAKKIRRREYVTDGGSQSRRTLSQNAPFYSIVKAHSTSPIPTTPHSLYKPRNYSALHRNHHRLQHCPVSGSPSLTSYRYLH
jgi:hypothetical protein